MSEDVKFLQFRIGVLLGLIELVRNHPEFDNGGPMADAMDQALKGETPKLLVSLTFLRDGRRPPDACPLCNGTPTPQLGGDSK